MKVFLTRFTILAVALLLVSPVFASALEDKKNEWAFDFSYTDTEDVSKDIALDGSVNWIFGKGRHQIGPLVSYLKIDPDTGASFDGLSIGPIYTFNFSPDNDTLTWLGEAAYSITSGDLGDFVDSVLHLGVGVRLYVGDSGAVRIIGFLDKAQGADGFADQDTTGLAVGISIFSGK